MHADVGHVFKHVHILGNIKILIRSGKTADLDLTVQKGFVMVANHRTVDACAFAGVHLDEAFLEIARLDLLERFDAVLHAVHSDVCKAGILRIHALDHAALDGEEARALMADIHRALTCGRDVLLVHPGFQLLKGQHGVTVIIQFGFLFFGNARTDKDRLCFRLLFLDQFAMRKHRRENRGKIGKGSRMILLDEGIDAVAARRNDNVMLAAGNHALIFLLDDRGADRSFFSVGKSELPEHSAHGLKVQKREFRNEGRRNACNDRMAGCNQLLNAGNVIANLFGVLRAVDKAAPAQNAFVRNNVGLAIRELDALDRAIPNAFITVLAVRLLELKDFVHFARPPRTFSSNT